MPTTSTFTLFAGTAVVLILIPGPNMLFIVTRGISQGRRAAFASALGVELGTLVHVFGTAVGLSALIAASAAAFSAIKYAGAAYLFYLAVRALRGGEISAEEPVRRAPVRRLITQGIVVNVFNPKVALFCLALIPQFIDPRQGPAVPQTLALGVVLIGIALVCDCAYALGSAGLGGWLRGRPDILRRQKYVSAVVYAALGVYAALAHPPART